MAVARQVIGCAVAGDELLECLLPVYLGAQQLADLGRDVTLASTRSLCFRLATPQCVINLLLQLLLLLCGQVLRTFPVVVIHDFTALALASATALAVLSKVIEHTLSVPDMLIVILGVIQSQVATIWIARHGHYQTVGVRLQDVAVNNIVTSTIS